MCIVVALGLRLETNRETWLSTRKGLVEEGCLVGLTDAAEC